MLSGCLSGLLQAFRIALWGVLLLAALLLCAVTVAGFYVAVVFPSLRPMRALAGTFQNLGEARVLDTEQHGAFLIGDTMYTATVLVRGERLRRQAYLHPSENPATIARIFRGWNACEETLRAPPAELRFYDNSGPKGSGVRGPGNIEVYALQHLPTHTYCLIYLQV